MKEPVQRNYDLNGFSITVVAEELAYANFLDPIFAPFAVGKSTDPDWTITVRATETTKPVPVGTRRVWNGLLPEGLRLTCFEECGRQILTVPGHFAMSTV